jgi:NAD+ diphosphatase
MTSHTPEPAEPLARRLAAGSASPFDLVPPLERGHDRRGDAAWVAARLADPATQFLPLCKLDSLVCGDPPRPARLAAADVADALPEAESLVLLGLDGAADGRAVFGVSLPRQDAIAAAGRGEWTNLRAVADRLEPADWAVLAHARAMAYWHQRCRFCSDCGSPTVSALAGYARRCANPACNQEHYPRTDPAIIVLVYSGERCLLGRQAAWPAGRYSTLAGFMEPGESVEQAVAREVGEEAGVRLREARYYGSQSFPFPASLMLGFHAEAASEEIALNDGELADARWFTRRELREAIEAGSVSLPPRFAISHRLITAWREAGQDGALDSA